MPQGVKLHAIIDACHSGSVMDLPYQVGAALRAGLIGGVLRHAPPATRGELAQQALRRPARPLAAGARAGRVCAVGGQVRWGVV